MKLFTTFFSVLLLSCSHLLQAQYSLVNPYPSLPTFNRPLELRLANDGTNRMFVLEQTGKIYVFENSPTVSKRKLFLDLSDIVKKDQNETGLLGMALHPNFKNNKTFYINYDSDKSGTIKTFISSFKVSANNPDSAIRNSEKQLLIVDDPEWNHNGGCLQFGPDKYLYFSLGDGGGANDQWNNAQNLGSYWGKIHRINVDDTINGKKYGIPTDNPFVKTAGALGEIYAYGLRNVWRFNFDAGDNFKLWAGDVGQNAWEEIDIITKGGNYGWKITEGFVCRPGGGNCDKKGLIAPVWTYKRSEGTSITGGYVYRGSKIPALTGKYIYADYTFGKVWALDINDTDTLNELLIAQSQDLPIKISSFAEDFEKEILMISHMNGKIFKLIADKPSASTESDAKAISVLIMPNPTGAKTTIALTNLDPGKVEIDLIDMSGKILQNIANEDRSAGEHLFYFDTHKLASGNYFVKVRCGKFETIKKLVKTN
jgi:glucose/arabinose dehydrogenase